MLLLDMNYFTSFPFIAEQTILQVMNYIASSTKILEEKFMLIDIQVLSERIRRLRHQRTLTQEQLAEKADLSSVYVSNVECGKRVPSLETLLILCHVLRCTPDELLEGFYPEKSDSTPEDIKKLFDRSTNSEKQFMLSVCSAFVHFLKDSL